MTFCGEMIVQFVNTTTLFIISVEFKLFLSKKKSKISSIRSQTNKFMSNMDQDKDANYDYGYSIVSCYDALHLALYGPLHPYIQF